MAKLKNLEGQRFCRWIVICFDKIENKVTFWNCKCDCGTQKSVRGSNLIHGISKSCGCLNNEASIESNTTHGMSYTNTYNIWRGMIQRCTNKNHPQFKDYGGRGIKVCERWVESFETFYEDMSDRPSLNHSINRIDNDGNYDPSNCEWATPKKQQGNTRRNKWFEYNGVKMILQDWANKLNVGRQTLSSYLTRGKGHSIYDAIKRYSQ